MGEPVTTAFGAVYVGASRGQELDNALGKLCEIWLAVPDLLNLDSGTGTTASIKKNIKSEM